MIAGVSLPPEGALQEDTARSRMRDQLQLPAELSRKKEESCTICHAKSRTIASIALRKFMILKDGSLDAKC